MGMTSKAAIETSRVEVFAHQSCMLFIPAAKGILAMAEGLITAVHVMI
jgi:hypothetical protein